MLIILLIVLYSCQSGFANLYRKHYPGKQQDSPQVFSTIYGLIIAFVTLVFAGFSIQPSFITVLLGIISGICIVIGNAMLIQASALGPYSVVMIFNLSGGILIPMLQSILIDPTQLSIVQYGAIILMMISFVFLNWEDKKASERKTITMKFLLYAIILGLANGVYSTLLSTQKRLAGESEDAEMIICVFLSAAILAFILALFKNGRSSAGIFRQNSKSAAFAVASSVSAASAVNLLMYTLDRINAAVLYTFNSGGILLVSILWSVVIFKEKIQKMRIIGLILSVISLLILGYMQGK